MNEERGEQSSLFYANNLKKQLIFSLQYCIISSVVQRGVAKFGIALGSGPRGHGFKSRHSDQKSVDFVGGFFIQADRLGISSRFSVYIIAALVRRISSHRRCVYLYRLDEIQRLCR